jgi:hypothetical protein
MDSHLMPSLAGNTVDAWLERKALQPSDHGHARRPVQAAAAAAAAAADDDDDDNDNYYYGDAAGQLGGNSRCAARLGCCGCCCCCCAGVQAALIDSAWMPPISSFRASWIWLLQQMQRCIPNAAAQEAAKGQQGRG